MKGYMYILKCCDGSYYTGSTLDLASRVEEHVKGQGANHTRKRLPVYIVYYEEWDRIDDAYFREKQVQKWTRRKKEALIRGLTDDLKKYAACMNESHFKNYQTLASASFRSESR